MAETPERSPKEYGSPPSAPRSGLEPWGWAERTIEKSKYSTMRVIDGINKGKLTAKRSLMNLFAAANSDANEQSQMKDEIGMASSNLQSTCSQSRRNSLNSPSFKSRCVDDATGSPNKTTKRMHHSTVRSGRIETLSRSNQPIAGKIDSLKAAWSNTIGRSGTTVGFRFSQDNVEAQLPSECSPLPVERPPTVEIDVGNLTFGPLLDQKGSPNNKGSDHSTTSPVTIPQPLSKSCALAARTPTTTRNCSGQLFGHSNQAVNGYQKDEEIFRIGSIPDEPSPLSILNAKTEACSDPPLNQTEVMDIPSSKDALVNIEETLPSPLPGTNLAMDENYFIDPLTNGHASGSHNAVVLEEKSYKTCLNEEQVHIMTKALELEDSAQHPPNIFDLTEGTNIAQERSQPSSIAECLSKYAGQTPAHAFDLPQLSDQLSEPFTEDSKSPNQSLSPAKTPNMGSKSQFDGVRAGRELRYRDIMLSAAKAESPKRILLDTTREKVDSVRDSLSALVDIVSRAASVVPDGSRIPHGGIELAMIKVAIEMAENLVAQLKRIDSMNQSKPRQDRLVDGMVPKSPDYSRLELLSLQECWMPMEHWKILYESTLRENRASEDTPNVRAEVPTWPSSVHTSSIADKGVNVSEHTVTTPDVTPKSKSASAGIFNQDDSDITLSNYWYSTLLDGTSEDEDFLSLKSISPDSSASRSSLKVEPWQSATAKTDTLAEANRVRRDSLYQENLSRKSSIHSETSVPLREASVHKAPVHSRFGSNFPPAMVNREAIETTGLSMLWREPQNCNTLHLQYPGKRRKTKNTPTEIEYAETLEAAQHLFHRAMFERLISEAKCKAFRNESWMATENIFFLEELRASVEIGPRRLPPAWPVRDFSLEQDDGETSGFPPRDMVLDVQQRNTLDNFWACLEFERIIKHLDTGRPVYSLETASSAGPLIRSTNMQYPEFRTKDDDPAFWWMVAVVSEFYNDGDSCGLEFPEYRIF